jgi:plastocyanin
MAARPLAVLALVLLAALALAGCSGSTSTGTQVLIHDFKFESATLTVKAGTVVKFVNHDTAAHTATADDGSFDTGSIAPGGSADVHLDKAGTFTYKCSFHPSMTGTITVT